MIVDKSSYKQIENDVLKYSQNICSSEELASFSKHIQAKLDDFKPTLMIYGTYNAGKSTLLNALFGEEYAKTGDAPETKEVCEYEYNGYTIFDTPGLNACGEDDETTADHLNKSEVVLFVMSNNGSLEEEFVYNKISEVVKANKPIIIVLTNKSGIDLKSKEAIEIIDKVSQNLIKIGDRNKITNIENKVEICMVNAKSALKAKIENKNIMLNSSNILKLEEMIERYLSGSGQNEVINALNIYIKNFIDNILLQVDSKIDNVQLKKVEELITYLEKLKQSSEIKAKNIVDKKIITAVEEIYIMMSSKDTMEKSLNTYVERSILDINEQITQILNSIIRNLSTKIGEFSKEFEELTVNDIKFDMPANGVVDSDAPMINDEIKDKLKAVISDKRIVEEVTKKGLETTKKYLPDLMKGKGAKSIEKIAGKVAIGIALAVEAYNMYSAQKKHNDMIEKERQRVVTARNSAQSIADEFKKLLYSNIDENINNIFNDLIFDYRDTSSKILNDDKALIENKNGLLSILNKM